MKLLNCAVLFLLTINFPLAAQQKTDVKTDGPGELLNHLSGRWVLQGTLGGKQTTHDVVAEWILHHEYLRLHEVSRDKDKKNGEPAYEAIILLTWDSKAGEYRCLWLDNTSAGGLSVPTARAKPNGLSIPLLFPPPYDSLHSTFTYDDHTDRWRLTIDDIHDGKTDRFGDVTLTRSRHSPLTNK